MTDATPRAPQPEPFYHDESGAVRFWVRTEAGALVGSSIPRHVLHYRFKGALAGDDALATYLAHQPTIHAAVLRRMARGSIEPVMLRDNDFA